MLFFVYRSNQANYLEDCMSKGLPAADCNLMDKVILDLKSSKFSWLILAIVLFTISNLSRARRWVLLLRPLGYEVRFLNSFFSVMIAYFANLGIPRSGEFIRAGTLSRYEKIPFEKLMGTIVVDRLVDFICLFAFIGIALVWQRHVFYDYLLENMALGQKLNALYNWKILLLIIPILALGLVIYLKRRVILDSPIGKKISKIFKGFADGLLSIRKLDNLGEFIFHSILIFTMYFMMTYVVFFAFEPTAHLSMGAGLTSFVFGALGMVFPSPGGMGSYHFLVTECLNLYGVPKADGFSYAMISYVTISLFATIVTGLFSLLLIPLFNKNYEPQRKV